MKKSLKSYLLVFMNFGNIYLYDCTNQSFLNHKEDAAIQGKVGEFSSIDMKVMDLVSVNESGQGIY